MKRMILLLVLAICCVGCGGKELPPADESPTYYIVGTWEYTMLAADGNTYDTGTVVFEGNSAGGTYVITNIYEIDYEGDYIVQGEHVTLTGGEEWVGSFEDDVHLSGTWEHPDEKTSGTWSAVKL